MLEDASSELASSSSEWMETEARWDDATCLETLIGWMGLSVNATTLRPLQSLTV